jgi:tRNA-splicing ligase RtcB
MQIIKEEGKRPIRIWTKDIEEGALQQLKNISSLPFVHKHGVAAMPDVHWGIGATVGSVIATKGAIIPAAVGVDIGCGMMAVQTGLTASDLPDSLVGLRRQIERDVPLGAGGRHDAYDGMLEEAWEKWPSNLSSRYAELVHLHPKLVMKKNPATQLGTLGSGNHFIEVCLDESQKVWIMLHSGSRGTGNTIGRYFIEIAKRKMEEYFITLPDQDLAYLPDGSQEHWDYIFAVSWAQDYAFANRQVMMAKTIAALQHACPNKLWDITNIAVNCHHNYVEKENHFGDNVWLTRKGAIRARDGDLGIIPGSMGAKSYIVRGLGNPDSYHSCSHGAGRAHGRAAARKKFTVADLVAQTQGVECRKDAEVLDELPSAYKDIDVVMENQKDLVEVIHTLKQVICVKGA